MIGVKTEVIWFFFFFICKGFLSIFITEVILRVLLIVLELDAISDISRFISCYYIVMYYSAL